MTSHKATFTAATENKMSKLCLSHCKQETEPALNKSHLHALPQHLLQHDMGLATEKGKQNKETISCL